jgi:ribosomal protein L16 Arg81 hydroxylase
MAQDPARPHHGLDRVQYTANSPGFAEEQAFLSQNAAAMRKMMADMMIKPSGDIDRDFVEMMVPHHQGAVDMAKTELEYGRNARLRRLAQQIVATQQREITVMRNAVSDGTSAVAQLPGRPHAVLQQPGPTGGSVAHDGTRMSQ